MEGGDAVAMPRGAEGKDGHAEVFVDIARCDAAEVEEFLLGESKLGVILAEVAFDDVMVKGVVAGGDRSVGGEDVGGGNKFEGLFEGELFFLHQDADAFDGKEGGMAFVHMTDGGLVAEGGEGTHAADAEEDLLADAHVLVTAVEACGDFAVFGAVGGDIGVHQVHKDASDLQLPDVRFHDPFGIFELRS